MKEIAPPVKVSRMLPGNILVDRQPFFSSMLP